MDQIIITENTKRTTLNIDSAPVVVGDAYNIDLATEIVNDFGFPAEPMDTFKYKIKRDDGGLSVNEGTVTVNFPVEVASDYSTPDVEVTIPLNDEVIFSDYVLGNVKFDRIKIVDIAGAAKGKWLLGGIPINIGDEIFFYEIVDNLKFVADSLGAQDDYNILKFKYGHKAGFYATNNQFTINTTSLAVLLADDGDTLVTDGSGYRITSKSFNIYGALPSASFELSVDTTAFPGIGSDPDNEVIISFGSGPTVTTINTSTTTVINGAVNAMGVMGFACDIKQTNPFPAPGLIVITLTEVADDNANVDPTNFNINYELEII